MDHFWKTDFRKPISILFLAFCQKCHFWVILDPLGVQNGQKPGFDPILTHFYHHKTEIDTPGGSGTHFYHHKTEIDTPRGSKSTLPGVKMTPRGVIFYHHKTKIDTDGGSKGSFLAKMAILGSICQNDTPEKFRPKMLYENVKKHQKWKWTIFETPILGSRYRYFFWHFVKNVIFGKKRAWWPPMRDGARSFLTTFWPHFWHPKIRGLQKAP